MAHVKRMSNWNLGKTSQATCLEDVVEDYEAVFSNEEG